MIKPSTCYLCDKPARGEDLGSLSGEFVICERCGEYKISEELKHFISQLAGVRRHILSGLCREQSDTEQEPPFLMKTNLEELMARFPVPNMDDLDAKLEKLLVAVKRKSDHFGKIVELDFGRDYPLAYAKNGEEFFAFVNQLVMEGLLKLKEQDNRTKFVILTANGWKYFSRIVTNQKPKQGFVAAWFDSSTDASVAAITDAIKECGFNPMYIKTEHYKETIMDKALGEIRRSRFAVVDLTGGRGSVFYEAGFARALEIEAIYVYRTEEVTAGSQLEFYVRHYQCHKYSTPEELKEIVTDAIRSRIKD
jgi:hypothetical protein